MQVIKIYMAKKIQIGDVIEIPTKKGLAYAQYSHNNDLCGELLRILPGFFDERPKKLEEVVSQSEIFSTFFPLRVAIKRNIFEVVTNLPVPDFAKKFPLFRSGGVDPLTGKVRTWWLWDGEQEWKVGDITQEQRKLSLREIWNDTLLIEKIESGWTPFNDPK